MKTFFTIIIEIAIIFLLILALNFAPAKSAQRDPSLEIYILNNLPASAEGFSIISYNDFLNSDFLTLPQGSRPLVVINNKEKNFRFIYDNKPNLVPFHKDFDPGIIHITSAEAFDPKKPSFACQAEEKLDKKLINPYRLPSVIKKHKAKIKTLPEEKGLFITQYIAQSKKFSLIKTLAKSRGYNTFVIDVKYALEKPFINDMKNKKITGSTEAITIPWIQNLTDNLHKEGFRVIGRMVAFKDYRLAQARPDLAIKQGQHLYRDLSRGIWVDPYSEEVQNYLALLTESGIKSGLDAIQFDYIRFPAENEKHHPIILPFKDKRTRVKVICDFLRKVKARLEKYPNASLEFDIFGITAWQQKPDIEKLGQDLSEISFYVEAICPMLYPSHFARGTDGHSLPGNAPYHFVSAGIKRMQKIIPQGQAKIVLWVQGFGLGTSWFGKDYMLAQIKAAKDLNENSFLIWNANNNYDYIPSITEIRAGAYNNSFLIKKLTPESEALINN